MEREELNQLVEQARGGDSAAITSLVKAYHRQVKDRIRNAGVPEEDQKNAEIHSFSSAFAHISNLPKGGDFDSFLDGYVTKEIQKYMAASEQSISDILSATDDDMSFGPFGSSPSGPDSPVKTSAPQPQPTVEEEPEPVRPTRTAAPTVTEEEDEEEEEEEKPRRLFGSKKKKKVVEEEDEDEDDEEEDEDEKPRVLFHRHKKQDDDEDDEDEDEEEEKPRRSARKKKVVEEDEDDEDDDEDYEEGGGIPGWLLGVLIGILAVVALALVLYIFVPKVYDSTFGRIPFLPSADVKETATPTATPTATIETTPTPTVEATETPDASADATATASSSSETTATATPAATATASTTTTGSAIGKVTVNVNGLNIRSSASTAGSKVGTATNGQSYDVYSTTSSGGYTWYQIGNNQWIADNGSWVTYKAN